MKPIIVGLMPSRPGPCLVPMGGRSGSRLLRWVGSARWEDGDSIGRYFETVNLNRCYARKFDPNEAYATAEGLRIKLCGPMIFCGREVASWFGMGDAKFWAWRGNYVVVPHPSGRNRLYNRKVNCYRTGIVLREALDRMRKK